MIGQVTWEVEIHSTDTTKIRTVYSARYDAVYDRLLIVLSDLGYSAYLDFISLDSRPFEIASGVGFKQFIQMIYNAGRLSLNSRSIEISVFLPHPTPVSRKVDEIPYDFFNRNLDIHFCSVTICAIDSDFYLNSFCLCCKPYTLENQTTPNVRTFVDELLLEYGLSLNTNSLIVRDNEPKMIAALRGANRVGCSDHYNNKILEHSFTVSKSRCVEVVEAFDIIKNIVASFRRSHRQ
ncbi:unnamed protein product [Rotaria magnacalcarata]|uniref:Uncharacterized protein n=2 Tax=Rotaria magnacalcarata TaxID=392030 RepID=A0A820CD04_9BILA|nr:unnamed protein product [Rotaria magnacalcarata]